MKGWHRENYRHSLAARGISSRRSFAFPSKLVASMRYGASQYKSPSVSGTQYRAERLAGGKRFDSTIAVLSPEEKMMAESIKVRGAFPYGDTRITHLRNLVSNLVPDDGMIKDKFVLEATNMVERATNLDLDLNIGEEQNEITGEIKVLTPRLIVDDIVDKQYSRVPGDWVYSSSAGEFISPEKYKNQNEVKFDGFGSRLRGDYDLNW